MSHSILLIVLIALCIGLAIYVPFIRNIQNTLTAITPQNRKLEPQMVWILLVPFVSMIWQFSLSKSLSQSIEEELKERQLSSKPEPTYGAGLAYSILNIITLVLSLLKPLAFIFSILYSLSAISTLVLFIVYWVQIAEFKNMLQNQRPHAAAQEDTV